MLSNELRQYILTRSKKLRLEIKKTKDWSDEQPTTPRFWGLKYKRWMWTDEDKIGRIAVIPKPGVLSTKNSYWSSATRHSTSKIWFH